MSEANDRKIEDADPDTNVQGNELIPVSDDNLPKCLSVSQIKDFVLAKIAAISAASETDLDEDKVYLLQNGALKPLNAQTLAAAVLDYGFGLAPVSSITGNEVVGVKDAGTKKTITLSALQTWLGTNLDVAGMTAAGNLAANDLAVVSQASGVRKVTLGNFNAFVHAAFAAYVASLTAKNENLTGEELVYIVDQGVAKKTTVSALLSSVGDGDVIAPEETTFDGDVPQWSATQKKLKKGLPVATEISASPTGTKLVTEGAVKTALDEIQADVDGKVDAESGKGLSTNDFTTSHKTKLESLAEIDSVDTSQMSIDGTTKKLSITAVPQSAVTGLSDALREKVDAVTGKGLSTNDFTNADKTKVDSALTANDVTPETIEDGVKIATIGGKDIKIPPSDVGDLTGSDIPVSDTDETTIAAKISSMDNSISGKVDAEDGKGLSSNDFTDEYKNAVEFLSPVSTGGPGLCPTLPNDSGKFLNGLGQWRVPAQGTAADVQPVEDDPSLVKKIATIAEKDIMAPMGGYELKKVTVSANSSTITLENHKFYEIVLGSYTGTTINIPRQNSKDPIDIVVHLTGDDEDESLEGKGSFHMTGKIDAFGFSTDFSLADNSIDFDDFLDVSELGSRGVKIRIYGETDYLDPNTGIRRVVLTPFDSVTRQAVAQDIIDSVVPVTGDATLTKKIATIGGKDIMAPQGGGGQFGYSTPEEIVISQDGQVINLENHTFVVISSDGPHYDVAINLPQFSDSEPLDVIVSVAFDLENVSGFFSANGVTFRSFATVQHAYRSNSIGFDVFLLDRNLPNIFRFISEHSLIEDGGVSKIVDILPQGCPSFEDVAFNIRESIIAYRSRDPAVDDHAGAGSLWYSSSSSSLFINTASDYHSTPNWKKLAFANE